MGGILVGVLGKGGIRGRVGCFLRGRRGWGREGGCRGMVWLLRNRKVWGGMGGGGGGWCLVKMWGGGGWGWEYL